MSEYKPITGELRKAMVRWGWCESDGTITVSSTPPNIEAEPFLTIVGSRFDHLCDTIDSIHANLECENERMREQDNWGLVMPKDADGEYIHIGDVMDFSKNVRNLTVLGIGMMNESECSWGVFVREGRDYVWYNAEFLRHHALTVEDVLREFYVLAVRGKEAHAEDVDGDVLAEYAAKLRLAGDAE